MSDFLQVVGFDPLTVTALPGSPGPAGVSVASATINGSNHLILTMSDASTIDAGLVAGGSGAVASVNTKTGTVVLTADDIGDGITFKAYSATDKTKLAGVATGATANSTDAVLLARANHTGTESADVLTDGTTNKAFLATERTKLTAITGTNTGDQTITLTGDATASGTGSMAVTVGKINGTALSGLGTGLLKNTTGTGVPSIAAGADIPNIAESQVTNLVTDLASKATKLVPTASKTGAYNAVDGDLVLADATSAGFTVTLPTPTAGRCIGVKKTDSSANVVTVATASGVIDGSATRPLSAQYQSQVFVADGTNWQRDVVPGVAAIAATGTPSSTTYLRGDGSWNTPAGGGSASAVQAAGGHAGLWYAPPATGSLLGSVAPAVGTMHAVPLVVPACTLQALAVRVLTNVASSLIRLGIYADDGTGYPGALILDAGQVSGATAGVISATISQAVSGLIWLTSVNQTGTPACQSQADTFYGLGVSNANVLHALARDVVYGGYSMTGVTAALPGTFSTTVTEITAAIRVAARVA